MNDLPAPIVPARWEKISQHLHANCQVFDVLSARYRHPVRKRERDFVVMTVPIGSTSSLSLRSSAVLVRQFRFGIDDFSLEIPGGLWSAAKNRWPRRSASCARRPAYR